MQAGKAFLPPKKVVFWTEINKTLGYRGSTSIKIRENN